MNLQTVTTKEKRIPKPEWLKIKLGKNLQYKQTKQILQHNCMNTICTSGRCPNQGECWSKGTATFMIGGDICTRNCKFCNTQTGRPHALNPEEPQLVARSIKELGIKHAVITSVDRDDLPDYGCAHWVETIRAIKETNPSTTCEVLIPDFMEEESLLQQIIDARPEIISHNLETVRRLTPQIRSVATYERSLSVLSFISKSGIPTKTGIMLGLGEREEEILETMDHALQAGVSILTMGQYLRPAKRNIPVEEYVTPEQFQKLGAIAKEKGFRFVESGPLVRSSYHAEQHLPPSIR